MVLVYLFNIYIYMHLQHKSNVKLLVFVISIWWLALAVDLKIPLSSVGRTHLCEVWPHLKPQKQCVSGISVLDSGTVD